MKPQQLSLVKRLMDSLLVARQPQGGDKTERQCAGPKKESVSGAEDVYQLC